MNSKIFLKILNNCESVVRTLLMVIAVCLALEVWIIKETNYKIYMYYTVQLHSTFYQKYQSSVSPKISREEDLTEK